MNFELLILWFSAPIVLASWVYELCCGSNHRRGAGKPRECSEQGERIQRTRNWNIPRSTENDTGSPNLTDHDSSLDFNSLPDSLVRSPPELTFLNKDVEGAILDRKGQK